MQAQIDIGYDQLVKLVKQLPKKQWVKLKNEVEEEDMDKAESTEMLALLLDAPTFSKEQLDEISKATEEITQWRTK